MYMRDFNLMATYAYALRADNNLSGDNINDLLVKMESEGIYRPRSGVSTFTGQFKSIQIAWYMFGYYSKHRKGNEEKRLVFSPLGNLLLDNLRDKERVKRIFLAMLHGNGFRQPFSQMDERFNIYGFRLIFKLLRDKRLEYKLYDDEIFYYVMFVKTINNTTYNELVSDILAFRKVSSKSKLKEFKQNERVIGLACHEWRYVSGLLESAGIFRINKGKTVGNLEYGNIDKRSGRHNAVRKYNENYVTLNQDLISLTDNLLLGHPFDEKPYPEDKTSKCFNSTIVIDMYSFYPPELLRELGMDTPEDSAIASMLQIASDVNYYSKSEISTGAKFETALCDAFNLFADVEAERIGGSANVDIECIYIITENNRKKFDIEAKSTSKKLTQVNPRRLEAHRMKINSKYTIIVTPNYSTGVLKDIEKDSSVLIKSASLSNYLYQYILKNGRQLSYSILDSIVTSNIGTDITEKVNAYVYKNFGHAANDINMKASKTPSKA